MMFGIGERFTLCYLAVLAYIVWQIISALNRISRGVEDIAQVLHRMESIQPPPTPAPESR